jgi:hypothetical protein
MQYQFILIYHIIIQQCFVCFIITFHRDLIIGHLIWVSIGLGLDNFGFYIHNDTLQGLQRTEDIFGDLGQSLTLLFKLCTGLIRWLGITGQYRWV